MPMNVSRFGREVFWEEEEEEEREERDIGIVVGDIQHLKFQRKQIYFSSECKSRN